MPLWSVFVLQTALRWQDVKVSTATIVTRHGALFIYIKGLVGIVCFHAGYVYVTKLGGINYADMNRCLDFFSGIIMGLKFNSTLVFNKTILWIYFKLEAYELFLFDETTTTNFFMGVIFTYHK